MQEFSTQSYSGPSSLPEDDRERLELLLGQQLVERGTLDSPSLERALRVRSGATEGLAAILVKLGLASERDVAAGLAAALGLGLVVPKDYPEMPVLDGKISGRFLKDSRVLPIAELPERIRLAMADPFDRFAIEAVELAAGKTVLPAVAIPAELDAAIERLYVAAQAATTGMPEGAADADETLDIDVERLKDLASEAPVIRFVNQLIANAVEARASDIHIEPEEARLRIRYRIDGVLREIDPPSNRLRAAIISRIKIMARLNIAERRLPQDGRIKLAIRGTPIDLRVATAPTVHGESVVLRILDRSSVALDFRALGIEGKALDTYLGVLDRPHGILLMTGPTGSGKTTTLYTSLLRLNRAERKIVTVEDPVEYQLDGINQIQVKPGIDLTFANVLRSVLRHDPDIIMVGEIRDGETAEIAIQAALTGHLVLSTLHTNDAASSITRLLDMGVEEYLLTSTINGAAAQRLVRTLCQDCRSDYEAPPELVERLGLRRYAGTGRVTLYQARGCAACHGTGYHGRSAIFETLVMSEAVRRLVLKRAEASEIQRVAVGEGMETMYDHGMRKALAGETTIEEVLQVTREV